VRTSLASGSRFAGQTTLGPTKEAWAGDPECRDALRNCDIIFGCTDDHDGRMLLNRLAPFYLVPVIDIGLAIKVGDGDPPELKALDGRVTVLLPGKTCLSCPGVTDGARAAEEALQAPCLSRVFLRKMHSPLRIDYSTQCAIPRLHPDHFRRCQPGDCCVRSYPGSAGPRPDQLRLEAKTKSAAHCPNDVLTQLAAAPATQLLQ
jgi:hypothetical protein